MDEIFVVGTSRQVNKAEKLILPSVRNSRNRFLNNSQPIITEFYEDPATNLSLNLDLFEPIYSSRGLKKIISIKKNNFDLDEIISPKELNKPSSPILGIQGIITPTHRRILKPIMKKISVPMGVAKKRKPLKLLQKAELHISLKNATFIHWAEMIRKINGISVIPMPKGSYKYYIGKGNNGSLVNRILKTRFWWSRVDNPEQANLIWTQLKHKPTLDLIQTLEDSQSPLPKCIFGKNLNSAILEQEKTNGMLLIKHSEFYKEIDITKTVNPEKLIMHNRLPNNNHICNKKSLFKNMMEYYKIKGIAEVVSKLPLTFHVEEGINDPKFKEFLAQYVENSIWIIKPGEATNRGNGIKVRSSLQEIKDTISKHSSNRTYIIQKYIESPLLINKRKFDIRCYALVTFFNDNLLAYFYQEGYLRTTSKEFSLKSVHDKFIHLTNDAVQKNSEDYGKFEAGNKLSYTDFQKFLGANYPEVNFSECILEKIEKSVKESIDSVKDLLINPQKSVTFEVFGYDFMIDTEFNVWLIEVNTNPCLELSCSYLAKLIPEMLENAFKIALDPIFSPDIDTKKFKPWVEDWNFSNKFKLILSSTVN